MLAETDSKVRIEVKPEVSSKRETSLLEALRQHDSRWNGQLESSWRSQLQPAVQMMKSKYDSRTAVMA